MLTSNHKLNEMSLQTTWSGQTGMIIHGLNTKFDQGIPYGTDFFLKFLNYLLAHSMPLKILNKKCTTHEDTFERALQHCYLPFFQVQRQFFICCQSTNMF